MNININERPQITAKVNPGHFVLGNISSEEVVVQLKGPRQTITAKVPVAQGFRGIQGEQGEKGDKGDTGDIGPVGPDKNYVHYQTGASNVWTVVHNMQKRPSVTVVDSGGTNLIFFDVEYIDNNSLNISFSQSFGGEAYLN